MSSMQVHQAVQTTAKSVLAELASTITFGDTERGIAQCATQMPVPFDGKRKIFCGFEQVVQVKA